MQRLAATALLLLPAAAFAAPVELVLWHSYDAAERQALEETTAALEKSRPDLHVTTLFVPFDALADKLSAAVPLGNGPDLFVFAHDRLGHWTAQGMVEPLQYWMTPEVTRRFPKAALDALSVPQGSRSLYGLPLSMKAVALLYDGARVTAPPATMDALREEAQRLTGEGRYGLVFDWANFYTEAGFFHAFGGKILGEQGEPELDAPGNVAAVEWVRAMRKDGLLPAEVTGALVGSLFNDGKAAVIVAGPWFLKDVKKGIDARVAPLPAGPGGAARPFLGVEALYVSAKSRHAKEAFDAAAFLTSDVSAAVRFAKAKQPVANEAVWANTTDAALLGFHLAAVAALPMPSAPAMRQVWTPMDAALAKAIGQGQDAKATLAEAQRRIVEGVKAAAVSAKPAEDPELQALADDVGRRAQRPGDVEMPDGWWFLMLRRQGGAWCAEVVAGPPQGPGAVPTCDDRAEKWLSDLADQTLGATALAPARGPDQPLVYAMRTTDDRVAMGIRRRTPKGAGAGLAIAGIVAAALAVLAFAFRRKLRPHLGAYAYVFPAVTALVVLVFVPFVYGISLALFDASPTAKHFVGAQNFADILFARGAGDAHSFWYTFGMTVLWTVCNVTLHLAIGVGLALVLQDPKLRFKKAYRVLLIVPWAIPNYITALIWKSMFNAEYGLVNKVLGLGTFSWFDRPATAFLANLATNVWLGFPFMMVVALGALQSIPRELYEAAEVDGASRWDRFKNVTLPLLKPALVPAVILGIIWTFNLSFNVIYLVSGGAPDGATDILVTQAFRYAFEQYRYGYAAAYAALIFGLLLAWTALTNRVTRAAEGAYE